VTHAVVSHCIGMIKQQQLYVCSFLTSLASCAGPTLSVNTALLFGGTTFFSSFVLESQSSLINISAEFPVLLYPENGNGGEREREREGGLCGEGGGSTSFRPATRSTSAYYGNL
jgi:hypothetical protein